MKKCSVYLKDTEDPALLGYVLLWHFGWSAEWIHIDAMGRE